MRQPGQLLNKQLVTQKSKGKVQDEDVDLGAISVCMIFKSVVQNGIT